MQQHPLRFFENYNLKPRQQQTEIIHQLHSSWDDYTYFLLSLPTGVGKTYIATSVADSIDRAYILTSTLQLQEQYEKSWDKLVNLKGRGNYQCNLNPNFTVDAAPCSSAAEIMKYCRKDKVCAYYNQKDAALASQAMITNPVYMLYSTHCGFAKDGEDPWVEREALIVDEAHNLENHLVQFAESDVNPEQLHSDFGADVAGIVFSGRPEDDYLKVVKIRDVLMDEAKRLNQKLASEFPTPATLDDGNYRSWAKGFNEKVGEKAKKLQAKIYSLDKAIQPLNIFFNTHETPDELTRRWIISKYPDKNVLKLSPIYGDFLFHDYLGKLARKFVFLSATLGSKEAFCRELGIDPAKALYLETDSPFPPEKSPVIVMPSIKLSKERYTENVKKIGTIVNQVMDLHPTQRGIIHSVTYDLAKQIFQQVTPAHRRRLLSRDMDLLSQAATGKNSYVKKYKNAELLELHSTETSRKTGTVLLSPSMMEGVDLYDDLSEFQIIIKLPWGNLGDARIKHKSTVDGEWYANKMWLHVLQASGRSTRHEDDSSITYVLDENFQYFFKQWERKLPNWFKKRLVF